MAKKKRQRWDTMVRPGPGTRCVGQVRVSTGFQVEGQSLPAQQRAILEKVQEYGWVLVDWCVEPGESAKDDFRSRPQWEDLIFNRSGRDCEAIISHSASRWCRNPAYDWLALEELRSKGVWWECIVERMDINADRESGQDILAAIRRVQNASYVRELAREVHKGKLENAAQGYHNGYPPFGYQFPDVEADPGEARSKRRRFVYEPHPQHYATLRVIGELAAQHPPLSLAKIAAELNRRGLVYQRYRQEPKPFTAIILRKLLLRPFYRAYSPDSDRGTIILPDDEGTPVEGRHVAVWGWDIWQRIMENRLIRKQLSHGARTYVPSRHTLTYSGLLMCAACGGALPAMRASNYEGRRYTYYRMDLHRNADCPIAWRARTNERVKKAIREETLDRQMGAILAALGAFGEEVRARIRDLHEQQVAAGEGAPLPDYAEQRRKLAAKRARINELYIEGELTKEERNRRLADVDAQIAEIPVDVAPDAPRVALQAVKTIEGLADYWARLAEPWTLDESLQDLWDLRHGLLIKLFEPKGIVVDLERQRIVGLRPHPSFVEPMAAMLASGGWRRKEPGLLWLEVSERDEMAGAASLVRRLFDALAGRPLTVREGAAVADASEDTVHGLLLLALKRGLVAREREVVPGTGGARYRYALTGDWSAWNELPWWPWERYLRDKSYTSRGYAARKARAEERRGREQA